MKRILVTALAVVLMTVGIVGTASAYSVTLVKDGINEWIWQDRTVSWEMPMPGDFEIPYDVVTSAQLSIYSKYVDPSTYGIVSQENVVVGSLSKTNDSSLYVNWVYLQPDSENLTGNFDVASFITNPWILGTPLAVSLNLNEEYEQAAEWYFIEKAVLNLEYDNRTAPVPEPATMALLGFGMLGLAIYGKRRMNRDA